MRWSFAPYVAAAFVVCVAHAAPQQDASFLANRPLLEPGPSAPVIDQIELAGLRRISPLAIRLHMTSREGELIDARKIETDVHQLASLGWFREIQVEVLPGVRAPQESARRVRLIYRLQESPFLVKVDFTGSQLLSRQQIDQLLKDKNLLPHLGAPANDVLLHRVALALHDGLQEMGHPQSQVRIERQEFPNATLRVRFVITDGPQITVGRVSFNGDPAVPEKELRAQMSNIKAEQLFAGLRGKNVFTQQAFENDSARLLRYYQNHGYPEARIGWPSITLYQENSRHWLPVPHHVPTTHEAVVIPVEAGKFYKFGAIQIDTELREESEGCRSGPALLEQERVGKAFSAEAVEQLRRAWFARVNPKPAKVSLSAYHGVDAIRTFDPATGIATVRLTPGSEPPILVDRIEFQGLHRFSDRYARRQLLLVEGKPLDDRLLEAGLTRLTRTGYFRPLKKDDVRVDVNDQTRTANVKIQMHEIGQQRVAANRRAIYVWQHPRNRLFGIRSFESRRTAFRANRGWTADCTARFRFGKRGLPRLARLAGTLPL